MNHKGFTLIEMILGLSVVSMITPLLFHVGQIMLKIPATNYSLSDKTSIHQLQKIYVEGSEWEVDDDTLLFLYRDEDATLLFDRNRLVKTPGYEIFMNDLEDLRFIEKDKCIYMEWKRSNETYKKALLGC